MSDQTGVSKHSISLETGGRLGPYKKKRKPSIPWMKLSNLPIEIIDIIFQETGRIDYWTYRVFRELERFRAYLDPRYLVQTNLDAYHLMYSIPKDQPKENHFFTTSNKFITNFESHCIKYGINKTEVFLFMEIEVSRISQGRLFANIVRYLKANKVGFKIFLRAITFLDYECPVKKSVIGELLSVSHLKGSELILDQTYTKEFTNESFFRISSASGCKFYQFPAEITLNSDNNTVANNLLDYQNIIHKNSIRNVTKVVISEVSDALTVMNPRAFVRLETLQLVECIKPSKKTLFVNMNLLNLKELVLQECQTSKFSNNNLPSLQTLVIKEVSYRQIERPSFKFKLKVYNNKLPNLIKLEISTPKIDQIHQNDFGDKLDLLILDTAFEAGGSLGDVPHMVSITNRVALKSNEDDPFMLKNIFGGFSTTGQVKEMQLIDRYTEDLDYMKGKKFPNLEILQLEEYKSAVLDFPRVNMPALKGLTFFQTSIENVAIKGLDSLKKLIFTSQARGGEADTRDNWRWFSRGREYFVIDFERIPTRLRAGKINLRHHKADTFQDHLPPECSKFLLTRYPE